MIGAKTLVAIPVGAVALGAAWWGGLLEVDRLVELEPAAALLVGVFAALAAALISRVFRLHAGSVGYVRLARAGDYSRAESAVFGVGNIYVVAGTTAEGAPTDLPPIVTRAVFLAAFVCLGLTAFTNPAAELLTSLPDRIGGSGSRYCVDPEAAPAPKPVIRRADQRGCALIRRAYELGYAKDLGSCGDVTVEVATAAAVEDEICTMRLRDEPLLHYNWRLLDGSLGKISGALGSGELGAGVDSFKTKLDYVGALLDNQWLAVTSSPRSAHHLWTNLPDPAGTGVLGGLFQSKNCTSHYARIVPSLTWDGADEPASALVDDAFGQLLFSPRFGAVAGYCREYAIHWGAPDDACGRLAADPEAFLGESDALEGVGAVTGRLGSLEILAVLAGELGETPRESADESARKGDPARLISFQCLIVDPSATGEASSVEVDVGGVTVTARELRVAAVEAGGADQLEVYKQLGVLLGGGAYTGAIETEQAGSSAPGTLTPDVLDGDDFRLARLDYLRDADPFLGDSWALERPDVLEVYPFELHLRTFTEAFRRRYTAHRGRL